MVKNILIGLIGVFLITSIIKSVTEYRKNLKFHATFKEEYQKEKDRNNQLRMQAIHESDSFELEKTIRNRLNLIKENEVAIIVPTPTTTPVRPTPTPQPVYQQWAAVFFKN